MPCPIPLYAFIIICMPCQFVAYASDYEEQHFKECAPSTCEGFSKISYPFRLPDQPEYCGCGYPGFEVECVEDGPHIYNLIMTLEFIRYKVKHITWENQSLYIAKEESWLDLCPEQHINTTLDPSLFEIVGQNDTLYYHCKVSQIDVADKFSCEIPNAGRYGYLLPYTPDLREQQIQLSEGCDYSISVPLPKRKPDPHPSPPEFTMHASIVAALDEGFEVRWKVDMQQCSNCTSSGGSCGHNTTTHEFICLCPEGVHQKTCPRSAEPPVPTASESHRKKVLKTAIGIGAGLGGLILIVAAFFFFYQRRNRRKYAPTSYMTRSLSSAYSSRTDCEKDDCYGLPTFDYEELREATNNFDQNKEVGDGGFGTVYKGKLRDGRVVAIKRLYENNYKRKEQFLNEVEILARLRHPNLVILYGCTSPYSQKLLLVYEFISNGTVADHLHGDRAEPSSLSWFTRLNIAIETAAALLYLHRSDVIHRDVKTYNILLDDNFSVKVADFGLSRLFPFNVTHVSTAPQGTPGYVDPEYHQCYQLTEKSDVYSFGVVLMELISSLPAVDITRHRHEINLSTMAINKIQSGALHELVDKHLGYDCNDNIQKMITAVAELAFRCLQHGKEMRPCMEEVLETLMSIQNLDNPTNKAAEMDSLPDDAVLLKSELIHSPDSVMVKLDSTLTTPNVSG